MVCWVQWDAFAWMLNDMSCLPLTEFHCLGSLSFQPFIPKSWLRKCLTTCQPDCGKHGLWPSRFKRLGNPRVVFPRWCSVTALTTMYICKMAMSYSTTLACQLQVSLMETGYGASLEPRGGMTRWREIERSAENLKEANAMFVSQSKTCSHVPLGTKSRDGEGTGTFENVDIVYEDLDNRYNTVNGVTSAAVPKSKKRLEGLRLAERLGCGSLSESSA